MEQQGGEAPEQPAGEASEQPTAPPNEAQDTHRQDDQPILDPPRLLRLASVTREVLEEARRIKPEPAAVDHLRRVHSQICQELREALPRELYEELDELTPDIRTGSLEELALAHAEILGWLEGLFQGTQLALQMHAARALTEQNQRVQRPPGELPTTTGLPQAPGDERDPRYL